MPVAFILDGRKEEAYGREGVVRIRSSFPGIAMGLCKDPSLTYLNQFGYNVVRLPRAGIEPLDVLGRDGRALERLGSLPAFVDSPVAAPAVAGPTPVSGLNGKKTENLDVSIGLKLLMDFLSGMANAAGLPSLKATFSRARSMQFTFTNVQSFRVDQVAVGAFLAEARLKDNPINDTYFLNEDSEEFVLFEVLKTDTVSLVAQDKEQLGVALDIPALQNAVGVGIEVKPGATSDAEVSFRGPQMVTFGFKCFRLEFATGRWRFAGAKAAGGLAFGLEDQPGEPVLLASGARVALAD